MSQNYIIGFPRIGEQRELKKVLEKYWAREADFTEVERVASQLKVRHWNYQKEAGVDFISSNDFSLYDTMLDAAIMLGAIPARFRGLEDEELYFSMARGNKNAHAMEMTKWFNTNYHYIVPELSSEDHYKLDAAKLVDEYREAKSHGITTKINLIGPITFLGLSKRVDRGDPYELFGKILPLYTQLIEEISLLDERITVQIEEPIFVRDIEPKVLSLIKPCYDTLCGAAENIDIVVSTYFEHAIEATRVLLHTPIWGIGLDFLYGERNRECLEALAGSWISYAQSRTEKIMKGMLTGPVTLLNWSFVRDDLPRSEVSRQIAFAIRDEVDDLQKAGIKIIQVDEAAFKEGYPLRSEKIPDYEKWAVRDFKIAVSSARQETQIHTHMCYSEFNDIIDTIEAMDADVISIETARSGNELLKIFAESGYRQELGPGVYDIHSPRIPTVDEIVEQIKKLLSVLPKEQLWINPDCGLKTRKWEEVKPSLKNMVEAVHIVRRELHGKE